jgi:hypothetical protein
MAVSDRAENTKAQYASLSKSYLEPEPRRQSVDEPMTLAGAKDDAAVNPVRGPAEPPDR